MATGIRPDPPCMFYSTNMHSDWDPESGVVVPVGVAKRVIA